MSIKLWGYIRVSTDGQNIERQIDLLKEYGVRREDMFIDKISGTKQVRPGFNELKKVLREGDTVITESLSRLSRSSNDLLTILTDWEEKQIVFISIKEQLDFSSSTGKMMLTVLAALAQFERDIIRDRVIEGLESARARGRVGGRPRTDKKKIEKAFKLYDSQTHSIKEIVSITGVSQSVLYRQLKLRSNFNGVN
ncbi:recombinase family protein [Clostridium sp.]|uniref:recombinase family protein n=1 Tax=Clostridium sp. TaxID=1506 RepID=UPI003216B850